MQFIADGQRQETQGRLWPIMLMPRLCWASGNAGHRSQWFCAPASPGRGAELTIISALSLSGTSTACAIHERYRVILRCAAHDLIVRDLDGIDECTWWYGNRNENMRSLTEGKTPAGLATLSADRLRTYSRIMWRSKSAPAAPNLQLAHDASPGST